MKEMEVLGGKFNKENYELKRVWVIVVDGKKIFIFMVYCKGIE